MSVVTNTTTIGAIDLPSRRNTELALLGFAVAIPVFAYLNVGLALDGKVPAGMLGYGIGLGLLAGIAHLLVRKFAKYADPILLPLATLLNGLGLVLIWRLDQSPRIIARYDTFTPDAPKQLMYSAIGVALFLLVLMFLKDHRVLQRYTYISMVVAVVLLLLPLVPGLGSDVFGAKIWIKVGPFSIQPGEFAKIVIAVFFSGYLMVKRDALALASRRFMGLYLPRGRDLGPILTIWAVSLLILVFENDLGTSLLFFGMFVIMLYVATERTSWIIMGLLMAVGGAVVVGSTATHVKSRVAAWLDPFGCIKTAPEGSNMAAACDQMTQVLMSFGSGGTLGTGLGQGNSDLIGFAANSDFIFATVGEELGLAGVMAFLLMYGLIVERGIRTALAARDPFGKLLAMGLSGAFALQIFVVAGGVMGLIPLTGMTMPFLAYGGSSVIANWALIAILLRISDTARRPAPAPAPSPDAEMTQVVRP
ncbi:FtsW/RodA/SpoVE family cell cycle protein [Streptomyces sp. WAC05374]|uniref:FtsW/RodA/SpoVE family cell cycle protein n=1 Tax=Streptomyces sp. WAC05374 TaxID=2487420 RepID=UPI000F88C2B3|nr:FtsW/RodA/SpoVE family cell cycle protein [Streptomyces sp. WAC05374]RST09265.1 FtsW/RodA/SpoVE family cell cycle protein [Streptomyces sp. WAC05374]TDF44623.1 FtsW/RodA/SpoVE family cell cycle protein [Streptomyces sp. WAC05374]TDF56662.1 FtsW/RodA/SpoVE family cell cycle protein [Streptomyces sp. WAC05374]TDF59962.1 FtsW/RodA/SpoVE family cell cycle protein [Streptomyces sp. WAC05374]